MDHEMSESETESLYENALESFEDEQSISPYGIGVGSLPAELKQLILYALPDTSSLLALISTCSSFHDVFLSSESGITDAVLLTQIHPSLLPTASLLISSLHLEPWSKERAKTLLSFLNNNNNNNNNNQLSLLLPWTLRDALKISHVHEHIQYFTADFVSTTITALPTSCHVMDLSTMVLSSRELHRIERAFYRFEIFCNLFRKRTERGERFSPLELRDHFFAKYLPCENEQLTCIYQYLYRKFSIPFNDVAEHDIEWAQWGYWVTEDGDTDWTMEHHLSQGLEYIRQVLNAETYDERHGLLSSKLGSDGAFLFEGLKEGPENYISPYNSKDLKELNKKQFLVDEDPGPYEMWWWAHAAFPRSDVYFQSQHRELRQWGYVMWDKATSVQLDIHKAWEDCILQPYNREEVDRRNAAIWESREKREEIWRRGGSGWWSPKDETKVIWPPAKTPAPKPRLSTSPAWENMSYWSKGMIAWGRKFQLAPLGAK